MLGLTLEPEPSEIGVFAHIACDTWLKRMRANVN